MLEIPEAITISKQLSKTIVGKKISNALAGASPHGFAFYNGDPAAYGAMLNNKTISEAVYYGGRPELHIEDMILSFNDGVNIRYFEANTKRPIKHQLLLEFSDSSSIICTLQMYGGLFCFPDGTNNEFYYNVAKEKPQVLSDEFDEAYFSSLLSEETKKLSAKAFLATEQRIPGLGNGILQDILWNAKIHPKRKMNTLSNSEFERLYQTVKSIISKMTEKGGRNTEKDLFGDEGGYITVMSKKNETMTCPVCGGLVKRMAYLGGNVYVCDECQKLG